MDKDEIAPESVEAVVEQTSTDDAVVTSEEASNPTEGAGDSKEGEAAAEESQEGETSNE